MSIISNGINGKTILHYVANATVVVAGNNSVSNVATSTEVITGATIRQVLWGTDTGAWTVKRGANTVLVLSGTNQLPFSAFNCPVNVDKAANVVITLSSGTGFIILELQKEGTPVISS